MTSFDSNAGNRPSDEHQAARTERLEAFRHILTAEILRERIRNTLARSAASSDRQCHLPARQIVKRKSIKQRASRASPNTIEPRHTRAEVIQFLGRATEEIKKENPDREILEWLGQRLRRFLSGRARSLDEAFSLSRGRGKPSTEERDLQIAVEMIRFRGQPTPRKHPPGAIQNKQGELAKKFGLGETLASIKAVERIERRYANWATIRYMMEEFKEIDFKRPYLEEPED